jgi:hypothetical protein
MNENVMDGTTMIQPLLESYSFNGQPVPVLLDTSSLLPDRILLMDDFFHVLIYHGQVLSNYLYKGVLTVISEKNFTHFQISRRLMPGERRTTIWTRNTKGSNSFWRRPFETRTLSFRTGFRPRGTLKRSTRALRYSLTHFLSNLILPLKI